jgi:transposase
VRGRFVAALDEGMSASAAGRRMRILRATPVRWAATWPGEGRAEALPMGGDGRSEALEAQAAEILGWLEDQPDLFLREIVSRLADAGVGTSAMSVARLLARHGITRKKTVVAAEQTGVDVAPARTGWREGVTALAPEKRAFIDESGFDTKMTRRFGPAARGAPCLGAVPHGHRQTQTPDQARGKLFIAGLRSDRIDAPMLIEGAMDGDAFGARVEQMLAPTRSPGDPVICDNVSAHKNAKARAAIEARGAGLRFLPACSPDLNPIEINRAFARTSGVHALIFAKLKAPVRSAAARCADTPCSAIASALDAFNPQECARYLRHAAYAST